MMSAHDSGNALALPEAAPAAAAALPAAAAQPGALLSAIVALAKDPAVDVAKLDALLKMQREMEAEQARRAFLDAYTELSAVLPRVKKNGTIDLGKGKGAIPFARWEDMDRLLRPLLTERGFTLSFDSTPRPGDGGGLIVTGKLEHRLGHARTASMPLPLDTGPGRNNLQAVGSTLSYGKRYCAEMLLNLVREGEDDDGKLGGTRFVTAEEAADLDRLIAQSKSDRDRFLQFFGLADLANLPAERLVEARNMLWSKIDRAARS